MQNILHCYYEPGDLVSGIGAGYLPRVTFWVITTVNSSCNIIFIMPYSDGTGGETGGFAAAYRPSSA